MHIKDIVIMMLTLFIALLATNFMLGYLPPTDPIIVTVLQFTVMAVIVLVVWNQLKKAAGCKT